jgi:hypothetical protein
MQVDAHALVLGEALRDRIITFAATEPRSLQAAVGFSELGQACDRRLAYRARGTSPVHHPDPLAALTGTGLHHVLAEGFARLDEHVGRYLIEQRVSYRGTYGTVDLFDRRLRTVIDWKTSTVRNIGRIRREGPTHAQRVQIHGYGSALAEAGHDVAHVALVWLPRDGSLDDMHVYREPLDRTVIDAAIDRFIGICDSPHPADVPAVPGPLCRWCPFFDPTSKNNDTSCPGTATPTQEMA